MIRTPISHQSTHTNHNYSIQTTYTLTTITTTHQPTKSKPLTTMAPHHPKPHPNTRLFGDNPALDYEDAVQEERKIRSEIDALEAKILERQLAPEGQAKAKVKGQRKEETLEELAKQFEQAEKDHLRALLKVLLGPDGKRGQRQ